LPAVLSNGAITVLDAQLSSLPSFALSGMVQETNTGNPIANAEVSITNADFTFSLTTDGSGNFAIPAFYAGSYDITVGKWNYITDCSNGMMIDTATGNLLFQLDSGYYDDFSFDFGWSISISGDTVAVGASREDSNQTTITNGTSASSDNSSSDSGAVYVYDQ